jgi:hypothetical protein
VTAGGGTAYVAVTVVLAVRVTVQVTVLTVVHPIQAEKVLLPVNVGAVSVITAPGLYVRVKLVEPLAAPLLSLGVTTMATALAGVAELTVRT